MIDAKKSLAQDSNSNADLHPTAVVAAIVVVFEPDLQQLSKILRTIAPQVQMGCIIHNGANFPSDGIQLELSNFTVVHLGSNLGVASALNAGFSWAQEMHANYVVSFDHDSEPASDMVAHLMSAYKALAHLNHKLVAVGPQQIDGHTGEPAPFIAPIFGTRRKVFPQNGEPVEVDHLISSGCLVPLQAWTDGGDFLEPLFIDYVDIEWCLRLRSKGWKFFGVREASLMHRIGEGVRRIGKSQVAWHGPHRHYFVFRNGVYLQKMSYISQAWKLSDAWQLAKKFVFFTLVARPPTAHVRAMLTGMRDGWLGKLGPSGSTFE